MITESVKTILGADLSNQVEAALKGKGKDGKDVDLVVGNDGTFVPADKYNGANSGKTSAENALKAAAEALKAIGGSGDPAKIADDVKTAQTTLETLRTNHQKEIRFLWASSNRATPSYTAGFFTMTSYTCLLIFRFATRAYWPGISDKKPMSSLMNASRVMVNCVP